MAKKIKKKRKIKFIPILMFSLLLILIFFLLSFIMRVKIKNIYVYDNKIISDQEIIELAKIEDYPSFLKISTSTIEKNIKKNPYIKSVKVKKDLIATINIYIEEYQLLFIKESDNKVVVDINKEISIDHKARGIPLLVNYVPDTVYSDFINEMKKVKPETKDKISQIEYAPDDYDKQRFLLYMNDGNKVYITITRFNLINKYNDIYPTLGGKKGILYLDSGNHFEIKN